MRLNASTSSYLDCLRFVAALSVLLGHLAQDGFDLLWMPLSYMSHAAVVVFFVLSGYIIHRSSTDGGRGVTDYVVARASRVYSVALPAIAFSVGLTLFIKYFRPDLIPRLESYREVSLFDILVCASFLTESWPSYREGGKLLTLNGPYWSLSYEVWYYVIFGSYLYVRSSWRWPLISLLALIAGPAILALFPIWCMGAIYSAYGDKLQKLKPAVAWATLLLSMVIIGLITATGMNQSIKLFLGGHVPGFWRLEGSQQLVTDYAVGLCVVANIHAFTSIQGRLQTIFQEQRALWATLAGFSFTLYLFHRPITGIAGVLIPREQQGPLVAVLAVVATLLVCWLISFCTEAQLPRWRRMFYRFFGQTTLSTSTGTRGVITR